MAALAGLPHLQQMSALSAYGALQREIMPFLREFAGSGRAVSASDMRRFFSEFKERRRREGEAEGSGSGAGDYS
jgi:hypothetical protein